MGEIVVGLMLSSHIALSGEFNSIHPSVAYKENEYVVGVYNNSYYKPSVFGGMIKNINSYEVYYGVVTGYIKPVVPYIAVKKELVKDLRFVVIPSFDVIQRHPGVILGLEITK